MTSHCGAIVPNSDPRAEDAAPDSLNPFVAEDDVPHSVDLGLESDGRRRNRRSAANAAMDRYAAGDERAFSELYDLLTPKLLAFLTRQTHDRVRAEDLLQQTMLQIHCMRSRFIPGADVLPWAFAIARRFLINSYRRRQREHTRDEARARIAPPAVQGVDDLLHSKRLAHDIELELGRLPEAQRAAFELMKKDGLSVRETAEVLGTTSNAVKLRAHRAYQALRRVALGE